jgi:hypothetical protein
MLLLCRAAKNEQKQRIPNAHEVQCEVHAEVAENEESPKIHPFSSTFFLSRIDF